MQLGHWNGPHIDIKHSMTTKSSVKYHYKRLKRAREGPKVYRDRPDPGGGEFYRRKVQQLRVQGSEEHGNGALED